MAYENDNRGEELYKLRHSTAHVMADAVLQMFPDGKLAFGPPIEDGFYYDFDLPRSLTPEDLAEIEERMKAIIKVREPFMYHEVSVDEAKEMFAEQPYKIDQIEKLSSDEEDEHGESSAELIDRLSIYTHGEFTDLCRGPHVDHTGQIPVNAFKLMSIAGAYWRGDESQPMLQRIYGTVWRDRKQLKKHLHLLEEAKKRDHRKLGKELEIFFIDEEVGPGLPFWLPRGTIIAEELERLAREKEDEAGYVQVRTPQLTKESLFLHSGHLPYYAESMYPPMELDEARYYVKPMNCPFHHKIFATRRRSYRELPLRLAEYGTCYRYEKSGELFGLMRVRSMQMNDAHIYCTEEHFDVEFIGVVALYLDYFRLFGIDRYVMRLSTHDKKGLGKKYVDNERLWLKTEAMVRRAMTNAGIPFVEVSGQAAFYGPKIDVQIWSAIGKEFTLATNQVDFAQPGRFNLTYINQQSQEETPLCIHRAPLGTHERTIGFLLEHYAGNFPVWLSPEQVRIIPITDSHNDYAMSLAERLKNRGIRVEFDVGSDRMNAKIRQAQLMKVPYMLVVGDREVATETVSLRKRDGSRQNDMPIGEFITLAEDRIASRSGDL